MTDWIEWKAGDPVPSGKGSIRFRNGQTSWSFGIDDWRWGDTGDEYDIVAYKLDEPQNAFDQAAEAGIPEYSAFEAEKEWNASKEWQDDETMYDWLAACDAEERKASSIAGKAAELVGGDRDRQHGAKADNFDRIAVMWNAWLDIRKDPAARLTGHDVGMMMSLMKLARTQSGAFNLDDYIDACGYAACAGEVAGGE